MKTSRVFAPILAALALLATASPAAAEENPFALVNAIPPCVAGQPGLSLPLDESTVTVCRVDVIRNPVGGWQASSGEWILFKVSWVDTRAGCESFAEGVAASWNLDGEPVTGLVIPCSPLPSGDWRTDYLLVSQPLSPGLHTVSLTWTFSSGGAPWTFTQAVLVV